VINYIAWRINKPDTRLSKKTTAREESAGHKIYLTVFGFDFQRLHRTASVGPEDKQGAVKVGGVKPHHEQTHVSC